jgi:hypothetical protein
MCILNEEGALASWNQYCEAGERSESELGVWIPSHRSPSLWKLGTATDQSNLQGISVFSHRYNITHTRLVCSTSSQLVLPRWARHSPHLCNWKVHRRVSVLEMNNQKCRYAS